MNQLLEVINEKEVVGAACHQTLSKDHCHQLSIADVLRVDYERVLACGFIVEDRCVTPRRPPASFEDVVSGGL